MYYLDLPEFTRLQQLPQAINKSPTCSQIYLNGQLIAASKEAFYPRARIRFYNIPPQQHQDLYHQLKSLLAEPQATSDFLQGRQPF